MNQRNCPNCGAPFELDANACPYCGTLYYDLTAIDFTSNNPVFLKIRHKDYELIQKCIPSLDSIAFQRDYVDAYQKGRHIASYLNSISMTTNVQFIAVPDNDGALYRINKAK